jgi:hypothetical protein
LASLSAFSYVRLSIFLTGSYLGHLSYLSYLSPLGNLGRLDSLAFLYFAHQELRNLLDIHIGAI